VSQRFADRPHRETHRYRIVVRGEIVAPFAGPLQGAVVESVGEESTLVIDVVDQSHLQGVLSSLGDRGIEIVSFSLERGQSS
jgi:hypothetical protein